MSLTIDLARRILEASKQRAKELRSPVSIAIVDAGGHLVLFERMMSPYGWATGNISIAKATTSVMFNQSTDAVAQWGAGIPGFASSMATMSDGKFIMAAGGWPIRLNGVTIGGIGVSGGNAPGRDDEIARAGLSALEAAAPAIPAQPRPAPPSYAPLAQPAFSGQLQPPPQQSYVPPQQPVNRPTFQPAATYPSLPDAAQNDGGNTPQEASSSTPQQFETQSSFDARPASEGQESSYSERSSSDNLYNDNRSGGLS